MCPISQRSKEFMKELLSGTKPQVSNFHDERTCNHGLTREDKLLDYISEYKRYYDFLKILKHKLDFTIPRLEVC